MKQYNSRVGAGEETLVQIHCTDDNMHNNIFRYRATVTAKQTERGIHTVSLTQIFIKSVRARIDDDGGEIRCVIYI